MESRRLIARNVQRLRLLRRMSQEALAFDAEIDRTYVSGIERGLRNPSVDLLDRLAKALSVRTAELFLPGPTGPRPRALPRGRKRK